MNNIFVGLIIAVIAGWFGYCLYRMWRGARGADCASCALGGDFDYGTYGRAYGSRDIGRTSYHRR